MDLGDAVVAQVKVVDAGGGLEVVLADAAELVEGQVELVEPGERVQNPGHAAQLVVLQGERLQVLHALEALAVDLHQLVVGQVQGHQLRQVLEGRLLHHTHLVTCRQRYPSRTTLLFFLFLFFSGGGGRCLME